MKWQIGQRCVVYCHHFKEHWIPFLHSLKSDSFVFWVENDGKLNKKTLFRGENGGTWYETQCFMEWELSNSISVIRFVYSVGNAFGAIYKICFLSCLEALLVQVDWNA